MFNPFEANVSFQYPLKTEKPVFLSSLGVGTEIEQREMARLRFDTFFLISIFIEIIQYC